MRDIALEGGKLLSKEGGERREGFSRHLLHLLIYVSDHLLGNTFKFTLKRHEYVSFEKNNTKKTTFNVHMIQ